MNPVRCLSCDVTFADVDIYLHPAHGCLLRSASAPPCRRVEPPTRRRSHLRVVSAVALQPQLTDRGNK